ncbi:transporter major facilitator superfamily MFS_1 [Psychromonas ingrahamii 37]|uniref:Transporter major facilitator superfamily MFS_1 n=1 Tax=Psychromonas ingrahamii (strain DSM 17664 / CCUG 51855 / 37) TaxID=357804 RepID=A1SV19_PSYIN|nr:MFS transporter [Psychromonas ingrahamii]ABM03334.1 transporter major facilitator superfamily MFS_1 [Psychromonas ingrahamii 37]
MIQEYLRFIRHSWPILIFGMMTVFMGNFGQSFFISWFGSSFQESLGLSATSYGTAYSSATLASGLLLMWIGGSIDKVSLEKFVIFCTIGLFLAALTLWQANNLTMLVIGIFLLRFFGQGLFPHTAITTMMKTFSLNRGKGLSVATTGVPLGEIILPSVAVFLIAQFGWQQSWMVIALSVPLLYLPMALFLIKRGKNKKYAEHNPTVDNETAKPLNEDGSRRTLLSDFRFWLALPTVLSTPFIMTGIFIHQGFFLPEMGWTPMLFANCFVFYGITHWLSSMYAGALVDRFSGRQLLKYYPIPMLMALLLASQLTGDWVAYVLLISLGTAIGSGGPIINALWAEVYGTKHLGRIRALMASLAVISTSISPILFGYLIDSGITGPELFFWLFMYVLLAMFFAFFSYSNKKTLKI